MSSTRVNRVTAEIAEEVGVLFENENVNSCPREQKAQHHARWSTIGDTAARRDHFHAASSTLLVERNSVRRQDSGSTAEHCAPSRKTGSTRNGTQAEQLLRTLVALIPARLRVNAGAARCDGDPQFPSRRFLACQAGDTLAPIDKLVIHTVVELLAEQSLARTVCKAIGGEAFKTAAGAESMATAPYTSYSHRISAVFRKDPD